MTLPEGISDALAIPSAEPDRGFILFGGRTQSGGVNKAVYALCAHCSLPADEWQLPANRPRCEIRIEKTGELGIILNSRECGFGYADGKFFVFGLNQSHRNWQMYDAHTLQLITSASHEKEKSLTTSFLNSPPSQARLAKSRFSEVDQSPGFTTHLYCSSTHQ